MAARGAAAQRLMALAAVGHPAAEPSRNAEQLVGEKVGGCLLAAARRAVADLGAPLVESVERLQQHGDGLRGKRGRGRAGEPATERGARTTQAFAVVAELLLQIEGLPERY